MRRKYWHVPSCDGSNPTTDYAQYNSHAHTSSEPTIHYRDADFHARAGIGDNTKTTGVPLQIRLFCYAILILIIYRKSAAAGAVENKEKKDNNNDPNERIVFEKVT